MDGFVDRSFLFPPLVYFSVFRIDSNQGVFYSCYFLGEYLFGCCLSQAVAARCQAPS
jgi:hypothetical protein